MLHCIDNTLLPKIDSDLFVVACLEDASRHGTIHCDSMRSFEKHLPVRHFEGALRGNAQFLLHKAHIGLIHYTPTMPRDP